MPSSLDKVYVKLIDFLRKEKTPYLIIGGLAVGVLGEPRMTQDIDLVIFVKKTALPQFLKKARKEGFNFKKDLVLKDFELKGAFRLTYLDRWVDFIISSTAFEESAFKRKIRVQLLGKTTFLPSPEDLIIFKLIPGRERDLLDAKSIIERHRSKLDKKYLENWAQKLSDEAEDLRVWNNLQKILK